MRLHLSTLLPALPSLLLLLTGAAALPAQQPFGPWMHDNSMAPLAIYVAPPPLGNNLNSGLSPTMPVATLDVALTRADRQLASFFPTVGQGVTVNVAPGTYTLQQPLSVPTFGISVEAYRSVLPGGSVDIQLAAAFPNRGTIEFDAPLGPGTQNTIGTPAGMPPSVLRGLRIQNNAASGFGVWIDPTLANPGNVRPDFPIEVEVNQCRIVNCARGIRIENLNNVQVSYACKIVDNEIESCAIGIEITNSWFHSDLIRSNRIHAVAEGIVVSSPTVTAGDLFPRIMSNAIFDASDQFGIRLSNCSAWIVNNTIAFVRGPMSPILPASIRYVGAGVGETLVISNNILFSPLTALGINPDEIQFAAGPFVGALTILANDFDATGAFTAPPVAVGINNFPIATPAFASMAPPFDVHLTAASPSIVNPGDQSFVLPGAMVTLSNGDMPLANCALDMDLDPRTHRPGGAPVAVLHRGADQSIDDGVRLTAPTTGPVPPSQLADSFGTVLPGAGGNTSVLLSVTGPAGSFGFTWLCSTLPMGPELQHLADPSFGSAAIDTSAGNALVIDQGPLPRQVVFNMGTLVPAFLEAEMYLQTLVFRADGTMSFSNRIRLEADQ